MNELAGKLYVMGTPIGNLEDLAPRAVRILGEVDLVAAEDTRKTGRLLAHFGLKKALVSFHEHNEKERVGDLLNRLERGEEVALVSDAGTPCISDPGYRLVRAAIDAGVVVIPIPGPSAAISALSVSGLPTDSYLFLGFLPRSSGKARSRLEGIADSGATLVLYEAPGRTASTLALLREVLGDRRAMVAREVTKIHEEFSHGKLQKLSEIMGGRQLKGEVTIVVEGVLKETLTVDSQTEGAVAVLLDAFRQQDMTLRDSIVRVATLTRLPRSLVYGIALGKGTQDP